MTQIVQDQGISYGNTAAQHGLQSIGASVSGNALTVTLDPTTLAFRSTTLGSGTPAVVTSSSQLSLTVPSGATLGTVNAVQSDIIVLAINNAGTMELAVVNSSGGNDMSEMGLISTTAISSGSTSASTIYSTSARTNVAYKIVGIVRSTQATAGSWATSPSLVQGSGGQALDAMSSLGYGQNWQNVIGSRSLGTTYYNTTGKPIAVAISFQTTATITLTVGGVTVSQICAGSGTLASITGIVPSGQSYVVSTSAGGAANTWAELR